MSSYVNSQLQAGSTRSSSTELSSNLGVNRAIARKEANIHHSFLETVVKLLQLLQSQEGVEKTLSYLLSGGMQVIPQAICSRFGLSVGASCIWLVKVLMVLCFPISYPVGKVWLLAVLTNFKQILFRYFSLVSSILCLLSSLDYFISTVQCPVCSI